MHFLLLPVLPFWFYPKILPLLIEELGSIARTATFCLGNRQSPETFYKGRFSGTGNPCHPYSYEFPVKGIILFKSSSACILCSAFLLSTNVIAFAIRRLFPDRIPSISSSVENFIDSKIIIKMGMINSPLLMMEINTLIEVFAFLAFIDNLILIFSKLKLCI
jgi:hypothetical protein